MHSQARCCRHNVIQGATATQFLLNCLRQRVLNPITLEKLEARLHQLATSEIGDDPTARQLEKKKAELAVLQRKVETVSRNMALAETTDERNAIAAVFHEFKAKESSLEQEIAATQPAPRSTDPDREVELAAMAVLHSLTETTEAPRTDYAAVGQMFQKTNARLFLKFREVERGHRKLNVLAGGMLTFGSAPPPVPLYEGPTDRAIIQKMLAAGDSVSSVPRQGATGVSDAGQMIGWSANVRRGTRRCT
jgi:hypothetical protein